MKEAIPLFEILLTNPYFLLLANNLFHSLCNDLSTIVRYLITSNCEIKNMPQNPARNIIPYEGESIFIKLFIGPVMVSLDSISE